MYTIQDLFDNPSDCIRCETPEDVELFRNVCEQAGYAEDAFINTVRIAKNFIRLGAAYLIRADTARTALREFVGLSELTIDKVRGSSKSLTLYINQIRAGELSAPNSEENSFNLDLFNQMLGV